jgi:hypothetical protein
MAQTKKKRRRKHRGTQGGRIDTKRRSRPRTREEAKARARAGRSSGSSQKGTREDHPPTWRSSINRGLVAAVIFTAVLLLIFRRPLGASVGLGAFMLLLYIPAGYYIDMYTGRRRERARIRAREGR